MRKKEFSAVILSVLLAVSACGGDPSGGAVKGSAGEKRTEAGQTLAAEENRPEAFLYQAVVQPFDRPAVTAALGVPFEEVNPVTEELYQYQGSYFEFSDEKSGAFAFHTEAGGAYKIGSKGEREAHPEIEGLGEGKELSFLSTKEAESRVKEVLSQIGFPEVKLLEICALPVAWHRCQEEQEMAAGLLKEEEKLGDRWDAFGDCYFLTLTLCYDGIPLYEDSYTLPDDSAVNGGRIRAILSKDGIQMLEVPNRYAAERTADAQKLLTREKILDKMSEKSAGIIRTGSYTVTAVELYYYPQVLDSAVGTFQLTPVYKITETGGEEEETVWLFRAVDGAELP